MKHIWGLFIGVLFFQFVASAQMPAYFVLGEKELRNADIYSILACQNEQLYIATNKGIYRYTKGAFQALKAKENFNSQSFFSLIENKKGEVFCVNLSGQVFQIKKDDIELYFTVPEKYVTNQVQLFFDGQDRLIYFSRGYCLSIEQGQPNQVFSEIGTAVDLGGLLSQLLDGRLLFSTIQAGQYQELIDGQFIVKSYPNRIGSPKNIVFRSFFSLQGKLVVNSSFFIGLAEATSSYKLKEDYKNQFVAVGENEVWGLSKTSGIDVFSLVDNQINIDSNYFKGYFISTCTVGKNGTIYLGTFGKGLMVVPNKYIQEHVAAVQLGRIRDIAVSLDNTVFFSELGKGILQYDTETGTKELLAAKFGQNFNALFWEENTNLGVNTQYQELYHEQYVQNEHSVAIPTASDLCVLDSNSYLIATTKGIKKKGETKLLAHLAWHKSKGEDFYSLDKRYNTRTKAVAFDKTKQTLYFSTMKRTFYFGADGKERHLNYKGKDIVCADLCMYNNKLWCATLNQGVLVFENNKLVKQYLSQKANSSNAIHKIAIKNDTLFMLSEGKMSCIDLKGNSEKAMPLLGEIEGAINTFELSKDKLWVLVDNFKILSINLANLSKRKQSINIYLDSVCVNKNKVSLAEEGKFRHNENALMFYVDCRNPLVCAEASIRYRIKGLEKDWQSSTFKQEGIQYNYLPPGSYTFEVYTQYYNVKSDIKTYSFVIGTPYWATWWFSGLIFSLVLLLFYLFFRYRIRVLQKREEAKRQQQQLKTAFVEAELRALRSQMNPHFIFNALHSIQALILNAEIASSYDYLVLFSKLVRNVLSYSNKEFISIESELDFLDAYLKLEKLRFENNFNYTIHYTGDQDILIPSLIIQPFVENALVHGLHHKLEDKKLSIEFYLAEELKCIIIDNGIGRKATQKIQERQGEQHDSFAIEAIRKRLKAYNEQLGAKIGFTITDLYENGEPTGTKVEIILPFKKIF